MGFLRKAIHKSRYNGWAGYFFLVSGTDPVASAVETSKVKLRIQKLLRELYTSSNKTFPQ